MFWLAYMTEDITLIYLWDKESLKAYTFGHQLTMAFLNSLISMVPRLLFTYFALYYVLSKLLNSRRNRG